MKKKFKYDGRSRPADDKYRKEFDRIFNKDKDPFDVEVKEEKEINEKELKEIADRNGF